jgi:hypothetical protein
VGKIRCECGNVVGDVESPCPDLFFVLPDRGLWPVVNRIAQLPSSEHPTDLTAGAIVDACMEGYKCPACGRLVILWNGSDQPYQSYVPEAHGG